MLLNCFKQRDKSCIGEYKPILGMIGYPRDLLRKKARVDRVVNRANTRDAIPSLHVTLGIPSERADPIAKANATPHKRCRDAPGLIVDCAVIGAPNIAFYASRYNLTPWVSAFCVRNDFIDCQWPFLHKPEHADPSQTAARLRNVFCPGATQDLNFW